MTRYEPTPDEPAQTLEEIWPPFGLRIESPRLALRQVRETDFPAYLAAASSGVTHTDRNPFAVAWNENPPEQLARTSLPWLWSKRGDAGPESWYLMLGVFLKDGPGLSDGADLTGEGGSSTVGRWPDRAAHALDGVSEERAPGDGIAAGRAGDVVRPGERLIGMQDVSASAWPVLRTVTSGSWLRTDHQGQGYGKEARVAMLLWAFDHFGAEYAESGAYDWNARSRRVSESLGYEESGVRRVAGARGEEPEWEIQYRLDRQHLRRPDWAVQVQGSEPLQVFFEDHRSPEVS